MTAVDGLLLCSECENQLQVSEYEGGHGFLVVKPCKHCQPNNPNVPELLQLESVEGTEPAAM